MTGPPPRRGRGAFPAGTAALLLAVLAACADRPATQEVEERSSADHGRLALVMRWPGDDFADEEALAVRDRVAALIEERGVGRLLSRGTGMGTAEIVFTVTMEGDARGRVRELMLEAAPEVAYRVESRPEAGAPPVPAGTLQKGHPPPK